MKFKSVLIKKSRKYTLVKVIQIKYTYFASVVFNILKNLVSLGLIYFKFILAKAELFYKLHEGINRKCIVLHRHAELLLDIRLRYILGVKKLVLLYNLSGIADKFHTLRGNLNTRLRPYKKLNAYLFF